MKMALFMKEKKENKSFLIDKQSIHLNQIIMKQFVKFFLILNIGISLIGCKREQPIQETQVVADGSYTVIADTIITDVVIKNPGIDEWTDFCLRNLDKKILVDDLFKDVYSGELIAHDFFNDNILNIDEVKAIENDPEFSRDKIAKVQFEESWSYNEENNTMVKKVHSIMLAYEIYHSDGEFKGYKPAFKVYLNK